MLKSYVLVPVSVTFFELEPFDVLFTWIQMALYWDIVESFTSVARREETENTDTEGQEPLQFFSKPPIFLCLDSRTIKIAFLLLYNHSVCGN